MRAGFFRRTGLTALVVTIGLASGLGVAHAAVRTGKYTGLVTSDASGHATGEIDYTNKTYVNNWIKRDTSDPLGDFIKIQAPTRDRYTSNGQEAYSRTVWWANQNYCYNTNGVSVSSGPKGQAGVEYTTNGTCTTGWSYWTGNGSTSTISINVPQNGNFYFHRHDRRFPDDGSATAAKIAIYVCQDEPWFQSDDCAGPRWVGSDL